jgi:hypothetical protein
MAGTKSWSVLFVAACAGQSTPLKSPPRELAVPLVAASAEIALAQTQRAELAPPWSLTGSDGSGLELVAVDARAVVEGPLAFTELHLDFHNPEARRREGRFEIVLPEGAAVTRFAMQGEDGRWREAEVVERMLARRSYEDVLHRKQDPALLETAAGNQFAARVFPIPPDADKHIIVSYAQRVLNGRYVLPLRGLPRIGRFDARVETLGADGKRATRTVSERAWQPDRDVVAEGGAPQGIAAGMLVAAEVVLDVDAKPDAPHALTLLVDTSASRALGFTAYVQRVRELVAALRSRYGNTLALDIVAFDQDAEPIFSGPAGDVDDAVWRRLVERGAAGASDLERALSSIKQARVVVVSDGVVTAGIEGAELVAAFAKRGSRAIERIDVVLSGGIRDDKLAAQLARAGKRAGAVSDLDLGVDAVAARVGAGVRVDVPIAVAGAAWVYPQTIASAQRGDRAIVYARMTAPARTIDVTIDRRQTVALAGGSAPLVEHAIAGAQIEELERRLVGASPDIAKAMRAEIAKRSIAARIVSSQTAMLVLESDEDYARYKIARDAPVDILAVGEHGLGFVKREPIAAIAVDPPRERLERKAKPLPRGKNDEKEQTEGAIELSKQGYKDSDTKLDANLEQERNEPKTTTVRVPDPVRQPPPQPPPDVPELRRAPPPTTTPMPVERPPAQPAADGGQSADDQHWSPKDKPAPLTGELAAIEHSLTAHDVDGALAAARDWHARAPGDVLALIALGDALEAKHAIATAARVYGSIIDLYPSRADLRRFAGERLERLGDRARWLTIDTYRRAVADRPDHITGHRLLAYALLRDGRYAAAFAAILAGYDGKYPEGRFAGAQRVLAEDAGMIGAAYAAAEPARKAAVLAELAKRKLALATAPSMRVVLYWETDANDVDLHVEDVHGNQAWYQHKQMESGGELYADVTTGFGPECFAIAGTPKAAPYRIAVDYYSQGPMGYGMGLVQVQRFDGAHVTFDDRPFVVMADHAYVDVGVVR